MLCGNRLLPSPCLLYFFYCNVQWGHWFTYLHMYSYQSLFVLVYTWAAHRSLLRRRWPTDLVFWPCWSVFTCLLPYDEVTWPSLCSNLGSDFSTLSSQTLLSKDRQFCESWRDAELGVVAVCAVGDTTDEDRWVDLLCCTPHCDTAESCLTNDTLTTFSSSSDCYDDWRRPSPTVRRPSYDASSPFRRCRLLRSCYNASAAQCLLLATSFWWCSWFCTMLQTPFSLLYLLVYS